WRELIWHFAFAHFPPARKKGPPKKWNDDRWCKLLSDLGEVKASRPTASDTELCINIKKRFANRYRTETPGTLRRNLQYAYLVDCFVSSPRLAVHSPEKECGKTTLLDIIRKLAWRPLLTPSIQQAGVFRVIERWKPTLLIDEADTFLRDNDGLR